LPAMRREALHSAGLRGETLDATRTDMLCIKRGDD